MGRLSVGYACLLMKRQAEQKQQPRADRAENRIDALNDMPKAQMREQQAEQAGKPQPHGEGRSIRAAAQSMAHSVESAAAYRHSATSR